MSRNLQPVVILVEPQLGANIGMCARAMLNCGLEHLRLVRPRDGWPNPSARATAADADSVLDGTEVFDSLKAAIADCHRVVATTARNRSLGVPVLASGEAVERIASWSQGGARVAVVFGPEASGLDNDSISRAELGLRFETNPEFPSLNLAQSVLLFGWEWKRAMERGEIGETPNEAVFRDELAQFLARLEGELERRGFFLTPELKPTTQKTLRSIFSRSSPSEREVKLLHGMLTALLREKEKK